MLAVDCVAPLLLARAGTKGASCCCRGGTERYPRYSAEIFHHLFINSCSFFEADLQPEARGHNGGGGSDDGGMLPEGRLAATRPSSSSVDRSLS